MEQRKTDGSPEDRLPVVIVYDNGLPGSDSVYRQVYQALDDARVKCLVIEGYPGSLPGTGRQSAKRLTTGSERDHTEISIVIPIFNEEENIPELYRRLTHVMVQMEKPYELIFVNDGSRDQSFEYLMTIFRSDPVVRVINLARNFGHQSAISAGLDYAHGQAVIVLDGDLQDPPEIIPQFIDKWREGFRVVYAIRTKRREHILKRFVYHLFYLILRGISRVDIPLDAGDFCLMDRSVVDILVALPERNRFVRGLRSWAGFRQIGLAYERDARFAGKSKYTFKRLVDLALDALVSFSYLPLRLATILGFCVSVLSLIATVYYLIKKITVGFNPPGFATLVVLITFLGGVQLITIGVIGEYIGRILDEAKSRPAYIVDKVIEHQNAVFEEEISNAEFAHSDLR